MAMTLDDVGAFAMELPGVTVGAKWGSRTWLIADKGFAWDRPLRKTDLERLGDHKPPVGDILAVRTAGLDGKDALLAIAPPGFFTIQHFNNYPAVLIELRKARVKDVRAAILDAYNAVVSSLPIKKRPGAAPTKKPAARRARS